MNCKNCKKQGCSLAGKSHEMSFECRAYVGKTNADRIRAMTDEELAIAILRFVMPTDPTSTVSGAYETAISAMERQIGKKPRTERVDYDKYGEYCINYYCPHCNRRMVSKDRTGWFAGRNCRYCECGQKIDWTA